MTRIRGVALVTALLVVALASLAATALMSTASLSIHRTATLRDTEAAWWVARGVEAWVLGILKDDKREYDGLDEPWAQPVDGLPIEQGFLRGHIVDLQGRFNLNNLLVPATNTAMGALRKQYEDQFRNLLGQIKGEQQTPPGGLIGAIRDWADEDPNQGYPDGAEDGAYLSLDPGYRTANRPFTVVSELMAVKGMTPELYAALKDLVAALPVTAAGGAGMGMGMGMGMGTKINVNTAPVEVLQAMGADGAQLSRFVGERAEKPATSKADFDGRYPGFFPEAKDLYDVTSSYMQIQGEVFVGSSRVALYSLINRSGANPIVLAHSADAE